MDRFKHTLFITHSLARDHTQLLEEAQPILSEGLSDSVSVLMIAPPIPAIFMQLPSSEKYEKKLNADARAQARKIGKTLDIPRDDLYCRNGAIRNVARDMIIELEIDHVIAHQYCRQQLEDIESLLKRPHDWHFSFHWHEFAERLHIKH